MKRIILSVLLILLYEDIRAQIKYEDSLQNELSISKADTSKVIILGQLSKYYSFVQPDSGICYGQKVVKLSQRIKYSYGEALGFYCIAVSLDREGNFAKALQLAFTSLRIAQNLEHNKMYMLCLVYYEIGLLNLLTNNSRVALTDLNLSINYGNQSGRLNEVLCPTFSHIAQAYIDLNQPDSALYYAKKGINTRLTPQQFIPFTLEMLGNVYVEIKNYKLAEKYYRSSFQSSEQYNSFFIGALSNYHLASLFDKTGQTDTSIYYAKKCLKSSLSHRFQLTAMEASSLLTKGYEAENKSDSTLKYMKLMLLVKDSMFSQSKMQEFQFIAFDEEQRKQQSEVSSERIKNQIRIYSLLAVLAVILLLAFIFYRNNKHKLQLQKLVSEKKQEELQLKAMVATQEEERKRISRDLHDDVGTRLSALKLFLSSLNDKAAATNNAEIRSLAERSEQFITETMQDVRQLLFNLSPAVLEEFGYTTAVEGLVNKINETNKLHFTLVVFGMKKRLQKDYELALYRITQELINNVLKHAKAKNASLQIGQRDEKIILMMEDDGKGFDASVRKDGYGLHNLDTRTELMHGTMTIDSQAGKGTSVLIEIPYC